MVISNIPLVNLRQEFMGYHVAFERKDIEEIMQRNLKSFSVPFGLLPVHRKETLMTLILQRVILGFEAFYKGAVFCIFGMRGADSETLKSLRRNPMQYGRGYCNAAFARIPGHLKESYRLDRSNADLFERVSAFYKEVRNHLFHGCEFSSLKIEEFRDFLRMYKDLYDWVCDWVQVEFEVTEKNTDLSMPEDDFIRAIFARENVS